MGSTTTNNSSTMTSNSSTTGTVFTPEEEKRIQEAVEAQRQKEREELIETEIRNRILDEQRGKPGYKY